MAENRNNKKRNSSQKKRNSSQQSASSSNSSQSHSATPSPQEALAESRETLPPGTVVSVSPDPLPPDTSIEDLWKTFNEAKTNYREAESRASKREADADQRLKMLDDREIKLEERSERLAQEESTLEVRKGELEASLVSLSTREASLKIQESDLARQAESLKARELNAEAGFLAERKASLAALEEAAERLRNQLVETERSIAEQRANWLQERQAESERLRAELEASIREREEELAQREETLKNERSELAKRERLVHRGEESLDEERKAIDERVNQRMARQNEAHKHELASLQDRLEQARADRDKLDLRLRQREETDRRFGQRDPDQVLAELDHLRVENARLEADLAARPDAQASERLRALQSERADWQAEQIELQRKLHEVENRLARQQIAATELETLRDSKAALEARVDVLRQAGDELRAEVKDLIEAKNGESPFPACSALDTAEYQQPIETSPDCRDLKQLIDDLQQRIAHDPQDPKKRLYYSKADLRCFLGGLAMGRLILLQGVSGTGKTSLPLAFARAVGSVCDDDNLIQVQAGWRDPQDLVGHYNAFEKRFYEQKFLRALYRAATPYWSDAIHVIVLDEMNLSHPEQYFSNMLSTLEVDFDRRYIELSTSKQEQAPALFVDGKKLKVPKNVWFVGTANQDPTTKDFADKTYDRSFIMEFTDEPKPFDVTPPPARLKPLSYRALERAFSKVQAEKAEVAEQICKFLRTELREPLRRDFSIHWGPRFENQLKRFCPVVVAAGGTLGEAADHMLAMRLLRQLRDRHDNSPVLLERLRERIQEAWPNFDPGSTPERSDAILAAELPRPGMGGGDSA